MKNNYLTHLFRALGELAFSKVEDSTGILKIYLKEFRERLLDNKILIS